MVPWNAHINQSNDPVGCTYQSHDPERYTYQSRDPEGCTYQSRDLEGYTYQSRDPEGCAYQSRDPEGYRAYKVRYPIDKANCYPLVHTKPSTTVTSQ
ncbi:NBS-LRR type resistance protein [Cucumis melo var. makuwa]|uniref:NBS-LRR type resistance protein n=1 Tax=Cucumis melo var. makuwa TaxID=1194695 RepID=A0A5A7SPQ7_CUCMM|nr:NBS-LRR type resistance protein [Cucumis melo var. makuwa]TYK15362.1 NBS-LRR type resistance protein [Cucumis melo var. makuwa]